MRWYVCNGGANGKPIRLKGAPIGSEAEAALLSGSALFFGGSYEHKVGPLGWDAAGRRCASAGGKRVVVWDLGPSGAPPPVRQNGRAMLLRAHAAAVTWLGFQPSDGREGAASSLLASAGADGRILMHDLRSDLDGPPSAAAAKTDAAAAAAAARARLVDAPVAESARGVAARESPMAWAPGGYVLFGTAAGALSAVRAPAGAAAADGDGKPVIIT